MKQKLATLCCLAALSSPFNTTLANTELPDLGDSASSYVSLQQEHALGRLWLRQLRSQTSTIELPLANQFLENLIFRLIPHSEVKLSDFEFVIIDRPELNAFAVPGGIIGINFGIMLYARDEDELSAVLAHELAHLSQRHFARQIENAEKQQPVAIAALLASILLIATNNADAGFAGLVTSQAASVQSQLAYSRDWEREADRIGMKALVGAGLDPNAMPSMFQAMLQANRFNKRPPEFLLTHPVTETRVADAAGRAENFPRKPRLVSFEFDILRNIAMMRYQLNAAEQAAYFNHQLTLEDKNSQRYAANQIALALIAAENNEAEKGLKILADVAAPYNDHVAFNTLKAELLSQQKQYAKAIEILDDGLIYQPQDFQLQSTKARILMAAQQFELATQTLKSLSEQRPSSPQVWRKLAEAAGKADQILLSHRANGEYLFATGFQAKALRQMELALKLAKKHQDFQQEAAITRRVRIMANSPTSFGN